MNRDSESSTPNSHKPSPFKPVIAKIKSWSGSPRPLFHRLRLKPKRRVNYEPPIWQAHSEAGNMTPRSSCSSFKNQPLDTFYPMPTRDENEGEEEEDAAEKEMRTMAGRLALEIMEKQAVMDALEGGIEESTEELDDLRVKLGNVKDETRVGKEVLSRVEEETSVARAELGVMKQELLGVKEELQAAKEELRLARDELMAVNESRGKVIAKPEP